MKFILLVECSNPMETELVPASLREGEIPHRTEWSSSGALRVLVPAEWLEEAKAALERSQRVFFGAASSAAEQKLQAPQPAFPETKQPQQQDEEEEGEEGWLFEDEGLFPAEDLKTRAIWPAWALAAVPGLGLGHLYAGKFQIFIYLVFASALGAAIYGYTKAAAALLLVVFSWAADLGFAAFHVKEHNRRAERLRRRQIQKEEQFLQETHRH